MNSFLHEEGQPEKQWFGSFRHGRHCEIVQIMPCSRHKLFS